MEKFNKARRYSDNFRECWDFNDKKFIFPKITITSEGENYSLADHWTNKLIFVLDRQGTMGKFKGKLSFLTFFLIQIVVFVLLGDWFEKKEKLLFRLIKIFTVIWAPNSTPQPLNSFLSFFWGTQFSFFKVSRVLQN